MKKFSLLCIAVALVSLGTGCEKIKNLFGSIGGASHPKTVADQFWDATKSGDPEEIKPFVTQASLQHELMKEKSNRTTGDYTLGEVAINGARATIPTNLKDGQMNIELQTVLVKERGDWKVDVEQTMMTMFGGTMGEMMKGLENLGKQLGQGLKSMGEGFKKGLTQPEEPSAPQARVQEPSDSTHEVGSKVMVEWHGTWYPSTVLDCGKTTCKIHYDGWSSSWDERVTFDRIRK